MYAIIAKYHGATDHQGARFTVRWDDRRATISYDYAARDAGRAAILEALESARFAGAFRSDGATLTFGTLPDGATIAAVGFHGTAFPAVIRS